MAKVIRAARKPRGFTLGTFVAAVLVVVCYQLTGTVHTWTVILGVVLMIMVDAAMAWLTGRPVKEKVIEIREEW